MPFSCCSTSRSATTCPRSPGCRARPWRNATGGVPRSAWGSRWSARWSSVDAANFPRQGGGDGGYYNYPVVRRPVWTWEVPAYFWLGGMAAGAYVTAALAQNFGSADDRRVAAGGYYVAAAALVPCAPLLIAATNLTLGARSKLLGGLFMASGLASGSAAVTLQAAWRGAPDGSLHRLAMVESAASAGEMAILTGYLLQSGKTARPLTSGRLRAPFWLGAVGAGTLLPLLVHRMAGRRQGRHLRILSSAAALCTIAGSLALRWTIFEAGKVSSEDQAASFELSSE